VPDQLLVRSEYLVVYFTIGVDYIPRLVNDPKPNKNDRTKLN